MGIGIPSVMVAAFILHYLLGVKLFANVPASGTRTREIYHRKNKWACRSEWIFSAQTTRLNSFWTAQHPGWNSV